MCPPGYVILPGPAHGPTHRLAPTESLAAAIDPENLGGDRAPPLPSGSGPPCRGRALPRPAGEGCVLHRSRWYRNVSPPCVGADLCVRPGTPFARDPPTGRHIGRPLQILSETSSCPRSRAGTEPRPYRRQRRRMPNAGSRSTRLLSPSSPASQNARNDSRHQSIHLSSPVSAQRSVRARLPESPVTPGWFPKEGPRPFLWSFQGGLGGKYESHRSSSAPPAGCGHPALRDAPQGAAHSAFDRSQSPGCHPPAGAGASRCLTPPDG